jgi:probable HAF family extracellular repeat protein
MARRIISASLAIALSCTVATAQPPLYRVTHVGKSLSAVAMNDAGQVTGTFSSPNGFGLIFVWRNGTLKNLGALGFDNGISTAINASGQITGYVFDNVEPLTRRIFFWDGNTARNLGGGYGVAINKAGKIAANAIVQIPDSGSDTHAHYWNGTSLRDLGTLGGMRSAAHDVNDAGQVTGVAQISGGASRAFLWNGSSMRDLGTLGGNSSGGAAINALGQIAGSSRTADGGGAPFLWDGDTMLQLGPSSVEFGCFSIDINDFGQVVGECADNDGEDTNSAFFWDGSTRLGLQFGVQRRSAKSINNSGYVAGTGYLNGSNGYLWDGITTYNLDDLIDSADPLKSRVIILKGKVINNRGQILAEGRLDGARGHTFVLTPSVAHDLKSLTLNKSVVESCRNVTGTVTLTRSAPPGGVRVTLKDTMSAASMPISVTVPEGAVSKNFTIRTTSVATTQRGVVGAILNGNSYTRQLRISPADC